MQKLLSIVFMLASMGISFADSPILPLKVTMRESALIKGTFVDQFRNEGDAALLLHVEIARANDSEKKTFQLLVPANGMK